MIVDLHTHLWQSPDQLGEQISKQLRERFAERYEMLDAGPQAHEAAMEPVDCAVVLGFRSKYLGADLPNQMLIDYVSKRPDKMIGFAGVDPTETACLPEVEQIPADGLSGITISPAAQDFHPVDTRAMAVYEACESLGLPVLLHQGTHHTRDSKMEYARPYLFDEVARTFPKLRLIVAHCGHPWIDETLTLIGKHEHVFADIANIISRPWQLYNVMLQAHQMDATDRLLFGSDFPYKTPGEAIETIYSLNRFVHGTSLPSVPREKLRAIIERDTLGCLGIKRRAPGSSATGVAGPPATASNENTKDQPATAPSVASE